jgi:hypothetical protein
MPVRLSSPVPAGPAAQLGPRTGGPIGPRIAGGHGNAAIPSAMFAGFTAPFDVVIHLGGTARYIDEVAGVVLAA